MLTDLTKGRAHQTSLFAPAAKGGSELNEALGPDQREVGQGEAAVRLCRAEKALEQQAVQEVAFIHDQLA